MPRRMKIFLFSFALWSLRTGVALATSYCAVYPWGKDCTYTSYEDCVIAAGSEGGCVFNPQEDKTPPDNKAYCLVTPSGSQCIFDDMPPCRMAAAAENTRIITNAECRKNPNH